MYSSTFCAKIVRNKKTGIAYPKIDPIKMRYFVLKPYLTPTDWIQGGNILTCVAQAFGRVLSEDVVCSADIPPYTCAIRDGWAVNSKDDAHRRTSRGRSIENGSAPLQMHRLCANEAVWVNTGGALPVGADAVISSMNPWDDTAYQNEAGCGENVEFQGSEWKKGELILSKGTRIGAKESALLAEAKIEQVHCVRSPKIGIIATGTEIKGATAYSDDAFLRVSSNTVYLKALFENNGMRDIDCRIVQDDCQTIAGVMKELSAKCDVIVTVGGTGKGRADFIRCALSEAGGHEVEQPALESKMPAFVVGKFAGGCALMGLPGNPLGVIAIAQCVLLPQMRRAFCLPAAKYRYVSAKMSCDIDAGVNGRLCVSVSEHNGEIVADPIVKGTGQSKLFRCEMGVVELNGMGLTTDQTVPVQIFFN
ncbi:MAG: molybdopterin-binding protein [Sutterellaceae bacterium]|nr:molybdopterin-binding protein [Sutterellaceae bacterium]